jgi:tRNA-splicing ligase RtcB (3'-phosphate/5'-hydroxy nucleic acid ligase)
MARIKVFGKPDPRALEQLERCARRGDFGVLCADNHVGYSQPIGGAVAYTNLISPTGVGYDIACLAAGTKVSTGDGYYLPVQSVPSEAPVLCYDEGRARTAENVGGSLDKGRRQVERLALRNSRTIEVTPDHLICCERGWMPAGDLDVGDLVACSPYVGLPFQPAQAIPAALVRLLGYVNGDGHLSRDGKAVSIYTTVPEDAAEITADLVRLGYRPRIYARPRGAKRLDEICVRVASKELHARFAGLGAPVGRKVWPDRPMPWLFSAPPWLRAQYLAAFAGAEMTTPRLIETRLVNLAIKQSGETINAAEFVAALLESFDFEVSVARSGPRYGDRRIFVVQILGGELEQLRFIEQVGFAYAVEKRRAAAAAVSVAWQHVAIRNWREEARAEALRLRAKGLGIQGVKEAVAATYGVSNAFVHHALYSGRPSIRRGLHVACTPKTTGEFCWVEVSSRTTTGPRRVYDLVTGDAAQSFLAEGIVVHNCGNKAARTELLAADVDVPRMMDEIARRISFGIGQKSGWRIDHPVLEKIERAEFTPQRKLANLAREQLGTVGGGNHYVDLLVDEGGQLWVGVHFGSRGFGHKTATGFLALAQGMRFADRAKEAPMDSPPVLFDIGTELGQGYIEAMTLAGEYAYAGRDLVVDKVLAILGTESTEEVHNHHNFAWREAHFGNEYWVVRKGCTPAFPEQRGFVGGSMGDISVILEGVDGQVAREALYSTVHGAGRVLSRTKAAGKRRWVRDKRTGRRFAQTISPGVIQWDSVKRELRGRGIELRGGGADEAPGVYKQLGDVLDAHKDSIAIRHTLRPLGVAMAGEDVLDPYRD